MRNKKIIKSGLAVTVAALIVLAFTWSAASQGNKVVDINDRFPVAISGVDNPCTIGFDNINLAGDVHVKVQIVVDETGTAHLNAHANSHLDGQDATGLGYVLNGESKFKEKFPPGEPLTFKVRSKLISQGSTDNFDFIFVIHVMPDGDVKIDFETECRG